MRIERGSVLQRKLEGLAEFLLVVPTTVKISLGGDGGKFNGNKDSGSLNQEMLGAKKNIFLHRKTRYVHGFYKLVDKT